MPSLRPGDIVIMDNLALLTHDQTLDLIAAAEPAAFSPSLLARPEPDRDDVEQGEGLLPPSRGPHPR